jgi:8-oxo-dGTP pyrophosphatase MutT (NUDIX family)
MNRMAHIHDRIDFTAEVFVVHDGAVLLRKHDKYGIWLSVGGHIELDEDPNEAAKREVREEVGLEIELWDSRGGADYSDVSYTELIPPVSLGKHKAKHPSRDDHEHVVLVFLARAKNRDVSVSHEGDKSDEWRWFSKEEIQTLDLLPNVKAYALKALEVLGR